MTTSIIIHQVATLLSAQQNNPFLKDSTDITAQYFLLIFDMLIQVNQKHLLAPFPASAYFFSMS